MTEVPTYRDIVTGTCATNNIYKTYINWGKNKYGLTPGKFFNIDTHNPSTTKMLPEAVASGYRHGTTLIAGILNPAVK